MFITTVTVRINSKMRPKNQKKKFIETTEKLVVSLSILRCMQKS